MIRDVANFQPLKKNVFVTELETGARVTKAGVILLDDDMTQRGIRERWGKVWAIGPEVDDLKPGDWILVKHGRWTEGIELEMTDGIVKVWRVEHPESTLMASDDDPLTTRRFYPR